MRKIILLAAIPAFALLNSCSAEEQVADAEINRFDNNAIAAGLAKGMGSIEFDFSRLFEYSTIEEAQNEMHKAIEALPVMHIKNLQKGRIVIRHL